MTAGARWSSAALAAALLSACGGDCPACPEPASAEASAGGEAPCPRSARSASPEAAGEAHAPPAEVRPYAEAPRRAAPPGTATVAELARGANAFVARLEMAPNAAVPEHRDADEEYIHVLEGHGTMWIDGTAHEVTPGTTIYMPAHATVRFQNGDERLVAIQVFAGPGSAAKYERWTPVPAADDAADDDAAAE
jgi:quercetin dioxygenase-like cupin family protein